MSWNPTTCLRCGLHPPRYVGARLCAPCKRDAEASNRLKARAYIEQYIRKSNTICGACGQRIQARLAVHREQQA